MSALILAAYAALILGSVALACDLVFMLKKYLNVSAFTLSFLATYLIITLGSALIIDRPKAVILLLLPSILVANLVGSRVPKNGRTLNKAAEEVEGGE
ncbi:MULTISPECIES: hypothetical protein [unclassified Oleiphilus]|uniref:hypothetical protein n=1 Tax=unclassified Oleiphilus TaxID=2631174 RepID=UPI0012E7D8B4|nr:MULTISPECIES: hypothetical protein [unclassified Oleiphilus]